MSDDRTIKNCFRLIVAKILNKWFQEQVKTGLLLTKKHSLLHNIRCFVLHDIVQKMAIEVFY